MADVFISHNEGDAALAAELADGLRKCGCSAWCFEQDDQVGVDYMTSVMQEIECCSVFLLLISREALASSQVTNELVHAHEQSKRIIPLLLGVPYDEVKQNPQWAFCIGAQKAVAFTPRIMPSILDGITTAVDGQRGTARPVDVTKRKAAQVPPGKATKSVANHPPTPPTTATKLQRRVLIGVSSLGWISGAVIATPFRSTVGRAWGCGLAASAICGAGAWLVAAWHAGLSERVMASDTPAPQLARITLWWFLYGIIWGGVVAVGAAALGWAFQGTVAMSCSASTADILVRSGLVIACGVTLLTAVARIARIRGSSGRPAQATE